MNFKVRTLFTPLLIGLISVSCEQNELEEVPPLATSEGKSNATAAGNIFEELLEGSNPFSQSMIMDKGTATSHNRTYVSAPAFQGSKAARFELRESDPMYASGTRTEVAMKDATGKDRWYSFAAYFPADTWGHDNQPEIISQWISWPDEHLGEQWGSPTTKLLIYKNRLRFDVGYNTAKVSRGFEAEKFHDLGEVPKDSWQEFVVHIIHSPFSDGVVEVWQNGKKVVDHKGGNSTNDVRLPFWKFGIYKWNWNGTEKTDVSKRVLYLDNVRIGDERASFTSMTSGSSSTPVETQPTPTEPIATQPAPNNSTTGAITHEFWANVSGERVSNIPLNTTPTQVSKLSVFETRSNTADKYGQRVRGYVTAPVTGNYTFWIAADDHAELWVSTSESPNNKVKVAYINGYTKPRDWNKYSSQKSVSIRLEAGKRYYIEALHKEGWGADNLAVGWRLPSGALERPIAGNRLSTFN